MAGEVAYGETSLVGPLPFVSGVLRESELEACLRERLQKLGHLVGDLMAILRADLDFRHCDALGGGSVELQLDRTRIQLGLAVLDDERHQRHRVGSLASGGRAGLDDLRHRAGRDAVEAEIVDTPVPAPGAGCGDAEANRFFAVCLG